ncbi:Nucleotidyltransferase domain protein [uncultured archaeon]|nr:Nucleotidyltransferase domain protein [uncultured archaeon]
MYFDLINKNTLKIIRELRLERLYFNQISERTSIKSKNNLLKNLNNLVLAKILIKEQNKSNTYYKINYENYLSISILSLLDSFNFQNLPFERRKPLEEIILCTKSPLIIVFGSTSKGDFKKDSDIDLLIIENKMNNLNKIKEISKRYGVSINPVFISFEEFEKMGDTIEHILKTGYPLTGGFYFYEKFKKI